jgi:hypothetical protein
MVSLVSSPILDITLEKYRGSLDASDIHYLYFSNPDTPRPEIYEIFAPEQEDSPDDESFAMSISVENVLRDLGASGIKIKSPSSVSNYLYRYSEIVEVLRYVVDLVNAHFDPNTQLSLETYQDQEYERLTLYVRRYVYDENTMKIIKKIRRDYHQLFPEMSGRFLLTTDFHAPR